MLIFVGISLFSQEQINSHKKQAHPEILKFLEESKVDTLVNNDSLKLLVVKSTLAYGSILEAIEKNIPVKDEFETIMEFNERYKKSIPIFQLFFSLNNWDVLQYEADEERFHIKMPTGYKSIKYSTGNTLYSQAIYRSSAKRLKNEILDKGFIKLILKPSNPFISIERSLGYLDRRKEYHFDIIQIYFCDEKYNPLELDGLSPLLLDTVEDEKSIREDFNADLVGDFALSTYEWEWAPYWLAFKRKLYRAWYVPAAYSELGQIHGHTILSFKISRSGEITELKVLRQVGHSSLEASSVNAVEAVFPFLPLPKEFPDEYLEVALKLIYPNLREYNRTQ